jgi:uncharacterized damage-inducible protein DinB
MDRGGTAMETVFMDYIDRLEDLHAQALHAMGTLPQEALDWKPGLDMNSFCVLIVHLAGAERYWIGDVAGGDPSGRIREQEFQAVGLDADALEVRLSDSLSYARGRLEKMTLQDLERECLSPRDGRKFTIDWALMHALEHTALHVGQLQILRQWWDQRA